MWGELPNDTWNGQTAADLYTDVTKPTLDVERPGKSTHLVYQLVYQLCTRCVLALYQPCTSRVPAVF